MVSSLPPAPGRLALSDVPAGARDETETGDLQTFGGIRILARYVKIEGIVSVGGNLQITEVFTYTYGICFFGSIYRFCPLLVVHVFKLIPFYRFFLHARAYPPYPSFYRFASYTKYHFTVFLSRIFTQKRIFASCTYQSIVIPFCYLSCVRRTH